MIIIVMNYADVRIEVLEVTNTMTNENVEQFLTEHGYSLSNISWMAALIDYVPVQFHNFDVSEDDGTEVHTTRNDRLSNFSVYESVEEIKNREQKELIAALRQHGEKIGDGFEYHFMGDYPIIASYDGDEPCDVVIYAAKADEYNRITLIGDDNNYRGNKHEIDADDVFAGHLEYVTESIGD